MKTSDICWNSGKVIYWNLDDINETQLLSTQSDHLTEDLAQIDYQNGIVLDIGWYPSFDPDGEFIIFVIDKCDWDTPILRAVAKDIHTLRQQISIAISEIEKVNHT